MNKLEINVQTGESFLMPLTPEEILVLQENSNQLKSNELSSDNIITVENLQNQIFSLSQQLNDIKNKVGA